MVGMGKDISMLQKTYSYRLEPTQEQFILFARFAGSARYVFNWGLARIKEALHAQRTLPSYTDLARELTLLKKADDTSWLAEPHSQVLQHSLKDLERGIKNFFKARKTKNKFGFPRFKKKGVKDSFRYPQYIECANDKVYLPKIG
jgi:putative transposase